MQPDIVIEFGLYDAVFVIERLASPQFETRSHRIVLFSAVAFRCLHATVLGLDENPAVRSRIEMRLSRLDCVCWDRPGWVELYARHNE